MGQRGGFRQGPRKGRFRPPKRAARSPWLIILNLLDLSIEGAPLIPSVHHAILPGAVGLCARPRRDRPPPPRPASSSLPTRPTAMASTSAWPGATNAARMPRAPIASHGILRRPPPIAASIPTKSRDRCRNRPANCAAWRLRRIRRHHLPALNFRDAVPATSAPRKRRDAARGSGYVKPHAASPNCARADPLMAGYA